MRIDVLTLFPEILEVPLGTSIVGRTREKGLVDIELWNIRKFSRDKHGKVDDKPYGGGPGMVLKPSPIFEAVDSVKKKNAKTEYSVILMSAGGEKYSQKKANDLAAKKGIIIICGRYEGVDERVKEGLVTDEISIGDYVISGGELAAMVIIESIVRLLPGALGDETSASNDSFFKGLIEYPQYTRPVEYCGLSVPDILLTGNHEQIRRWRRKEALKRTLERRTDIFKKLHLTEEDKMLLREIEQEGGDVCNGNKRSSRK